MNSSWSPPSIADPEDAARLASSVIEALLAPVRIAGIDIHTSPSIGIAVYPADGATIEALLAHADAPCTPPKSAVAGNAQRYQAGMNGGSENRVNWKVICTPHSHYSNSNCTTSRKWMPSGHRAQRRALIRWVHPERGIVSPADFIPWRRNAA